MKQWISSLLNKRKSWLLLHEDWMLVFNPCYHPCIYTAVLEGHGNESFHPKSKTLSMKHLQCTWSFESNHCEFTFLSLKYCSDIELKRTFCICLCPWNCWLKKSCYLFTSFRAHHESFALQQEYDMWRRDYLMYGLYDHLPLAYSKSKHASFHLWIHRHGRFQDHLRRLRTRFPFLLNSNSPCKEAFRRALQYTR